MKRAKIYTKIPTNKVIYGEFHTLAKQFKSEDYETKITSN